MDDVVPEMQWTHSLHHLAIAIQIHDHKRVDFLAKREVRECPRTTKKNLKEGVGCQLSPEIKQDIHIRKTITPVRTAGNLRGSRIVSVIGSTYN